MEAEADVNVPAGPLLLMSRWRGEACLQTPEQTRGPVVGGRAGPNI